MHARESREHLDRKQEPKINDPFTQNADIWREEGREEQSESVCDKRDRVCVKENLNLCLCKTPQKRKKEKNHRRDIQV